MVAGGRSVKRGRHRRSRVVPTYTLSIGQDTPSYARHIGRVGALAVALGVGFAVATGGTGVARAETDSASDSHGADAPSETPGQTADTDTVDTPPTNEQSSPEVTSDEDDAEPGAPTGNGMEVDASGIDTSHNDAGQSTDTTPDDDESDDDADGPADDVVEPAPEEIPEDPAPQGSTGPTVVVEDPSESDGDGPADPAHDRAPASSDLGSAAVDDEDDQETVDAQTVSRVIVAPSREADTAQTAAPASAVLAVEDPNALQASMVAPSTIDGVATTFVAALLSPFLAPGPAAPAQPPLLWALLGWVSREIQRTFFNRTPHAVTDEVTTSEDTGTVIDVLGNDTDDDYSDVVTVTGVTQPDHGTVTINPDGTLTYTPDADFHGTDTFTYTVSDEESPWHVHGLLGFLGAGHDSTATVTVTVTPVNDAPVARDDSYTTPEDTALNVPIPGVLGNDTDDDGDDLSVVVDDGPDHGALTLNGNGSFTYTPAADFHGTDTFTYTVSDGDDVDTATVTVTVTAVNDEPVAVDDSIATNEDTPVTIPVGANDSDADGDTLTVVGISGASNGTVMLSNGTVSYHPYANFHGTDSFTYTISDGNGGTATATVSVTVNPVNDAPAAADYAYSAVEDLPGHADLLQGAVDVDGDSVSVVDFTQPTSGGTITVTDGEFTWRPPANFTGVDTFTYTISDGNGGFDTGTVTIHVRPVNDAPVAGDNAATTDEDTPVTIDVLANDNDVDGDTLTPTVTTGPANGEATVNPDGTITYTPDTGFSGTDTFTYTVSDGEGGEDTATVSVTVNPDNTAPTIAVGNPTITNADTGARTYPVTITDPDGDDVTLSADPQHGTFVDNGDGTFSYTPDRAFVRTLAPAGTATETFTVHADDGNGGIATAEVTATINFINTRPTMAINVVDGTPENPVVTGHVELIDVNGDPVTYSLIRLQRNKGTLVFDQATGHFTFTPSEEARLLAGQPGAPFNDIQVILEIAITDGFATRNTGVSLFIVPLVAPEVPVGGVVDV